MSDASFFDYAVPSAPIHAATKKPAPAKKPPAKAPAKKGGDGPVKTMAVPERPDDEGGGYEPETEDIEDDEDEDEDDEDEDDEDEEDEEDDSEEE